MEMGFDSRQKQFIFLFIKPSKPALGPTQSSIQCVQGDLYPEIRRSRALTIHLHLVLRVRGAIPPLPTCHYVRVNMDFNLYFVLKRNAVLAPFSIHVYRMLNWS
jgi:hypothetical protein